MTDTRHRNLNHGNHMPIKGEKLARMVLSPSEQAAADIAIGSMTEQMVEIVDNAAHRAAQRARDAAFDSGAVVWDGDLLVTTLV